MSLLNYIKMQSRMVIRGLIIFFAISLISIVGLRDTTTWGFIKVALIILPIFLSTSALSDIYENQIEGILFSSVSPKYKQVIIKFLYGWSLTQIMIFVLYICAYINNMEESMVSWIYLFVSSSFLSSMGLFLSVISKSFIVSTAIPLVYWVVQVVAGFGFNEKIKPISVIIGLELGNQIIWINVIVLSILSIILLWLSLWCLSKGEKFRDAFKKLTLITVCILTTLVAVTIYMDYKKDAVQYSIIRNSEGDSIFVLGTKNDNAKEFLDGQGIKYITPDKLTREDLGKNIIYISGEDVRGEEKHKFLSDEVSKIKMLNNEVNINGIGIENSAAYRVLLDNIVDSNKKVIYMYSKSWTNSQLELLFDNKIGNFVAVGNNILAKSNYQSFNIENLLENLELFNSASFVQYKDSAKIKYEVKDHGKVKDILNIWETVYSETRSFLPDNKQKDILQLFIDDKSKYSNLIPLELPIVSSKYLKTFKTGGLDWIYEISILSGEESLFKNINDSQLRYAWSKYYYNKELCPSIVKNIGNKYLQDNYKYDILDVSKEDVDEIKNLNEGNGIYQFGDEIEFGAKILSYMYEYDEANTKKVIKELAYLNHSVTIPELKALLKKYFNKQEIDKLFAKYQEVKTKSDQYNIKRRIYK